MAGRESIPDQPEEEDEGLGAHPNGSADPPSGSDQAGTSSGTLPAIQKRLPFFQRPVPLERKQSSSDLLSRLKTRKILGVGETDNGDIHRSKLSQVLGHNEHLYIRFPRGYALFHAALAFVASTAGIMQLLMPSRWHRITFPYTTPGAPLTDRCYGAVLIGGSVVLWRLWGTIDKAVARALVAGVGTSQALQATALIAQLPEWWSQGGMFRTSFYLLAQGAVAGLCFYYYRAIGAATSGMRRAHSHKDIPACTAGNSFGSAGQSSGGTSPGKKSL